MELLTSIVASLLGPECDITVEVGGDGVPRLNLSTGGVVCLEPDCVILDEVDDEQAEALAMSLGAAGARLRRVHDFAARFPWEIAAGTDRRVCTLLSPSTGETLGSEGLRGVLRLTRFKGDELSDVMESECVVVSAEALDGPWEDWTALLEAYDARIAAWTNPAEPYPEDVRLELPQEPQGPSDEGWDAYVAALGLAPETASATVAPFVKAAFDALPAVRARYTALYGLQLPSSLATLAALVEALGALPEGPPNGHWEPAPGYDRGVAWIDSALGMRPSGLSSWFAPGALDRQTRDAAEAYVELPPGREGPLDARLDMRFRCDAPQFVTFLGGNSDGLHWGFWYDSPAYFPVIAHNYARDSAETSLDGLADLVPLLRRALATTTEEVFEELATTEVDADSEITDSLAGWRALRVVALLLDGIEEAAAPRLAELPQEPPCPWPRTEGYPTGSPSLALRPDSGTVPADVLSHQGSSSARELETRRAWIAEARRELDAGHPAYAHALGLYLHWADADDLREAAGSLLLDAYRALGFESFADILKVHLLHRDLPSVAVFRES